MFCGNNAAREHRGRSAGDAEWLLFNGTDVAAGILSAHVDVTERLLRQATGFEVSLFIDTVAADNVDAELPEESAGFGEDPHSVASVKAR